MNNSHDFKGTKYIRTGSPKICGRSVRLRKPVRMWLVHSVRLTVRLPGALRLWGSLFALSSMEIA